MTRGCVCTLRTVVTTAVSLIYDGIQYTGKISYRDLKFSHRPIPNCMGLWLSRLTVASIDDVTNFPAMGCVDGSERICCWLAPWGNAHTAAIPNLIKLFNPHFPILRLISQPPLVDSTEPEAEIVGRRNLYNLAI